MGNMGNGGGSEVPVQKMTFSLTDVVKIVVLVAGAVALYFQVNGRLDSLDNQIAALRSQQEQLRIDIGIVKEQTDPPTPTRRGSRSIPDN